MWAWRCASKTAIFGGRLWAGKGWDCEKKNWKKRGEAPPAIAPASGIRERDETIFFLRCKRCRRGAVGGGRQKLRMGRKTLAFKKQLGGVKGGGGGGGHTGLRDRPPARSSSFDFALSRSVLSSFFPPRSQKGGSRAAPGLSALRGRGWEVGREGFLESAPKKSTEKGVAARLGFVLSSFGRKKKGKNEIDGKKTRRRRATNKTQHNNDHAALNKLGQNARHPLFCNRERERERARTTTGGARARHPRYSLPFSKKSFRFTTRTTSRRSRRPTGP